VRSLNALLCKVLQKTESLTAILVFSVAKDCVVLSQYDLHHGSFLLVTPIDMSSYESTIIQGKSTSLQWDAVLSKLCSKVKKIPTLPPCVEDVFVCQ